MSAFETSIQELNEVEQLLVRVGTERRDHDAAAPTSRTLDPEDDRFVGGIGRTFEPEDMANDERYGFVSVCTQPTADGVGVDAEVPTKTLGLEDTHRLGDRLGRIHSTGR